MGANFFVSFAQNDLNKLNILKRVLEKSKSEFSLIVMINRKNPTRLLSDKVKSGILETNYFIPILTRSSILNQWVNQEIGFAEASKRTLFPIVENQIIHKLKGFINNQIDLPFVFDGYEDNPRKESYSFRKSCVDLVAHLESIIIPLFFSSTIYPKTVVQGDSYTTRVQFKGKVNYAFFDNYVKHLESKWETWNWDKNTLQDSKRTTPGKMRGDVDIKSEYTWATENWPIGKYKIYVRVYDHFVPGEIKRIKLIENEYDFEVLPKSG